MIKLLESGRYKLTDSYGGNRLIYIGRRTFVWVKAPGIGEILVYTDRPHKSRDTLAAGEYRLYEVEAEPAYTDLLHLELIIGEGEWQGYLLLTGFPTPHKKRVRFIPTGEVISEGVQQKAPAVSKPVRR